MRQNVVDQLKVIPFNLLKFISERRARESSNVQAEGTASPNLPLPVPHKILWLG